VSPSPSNPRTSLHASDPFLTDAQLAAELDKCEFCEEKPCREACPCDCSPADFLKAAEIGSPSDLRRSAALIKGQNPLGGICGMVCPDRFCMAACVHRELDGPVLIPEVQAAIVERAKRLGEMPRFVDAADTGKRVAVIGSGPAGLGAAAVLAQRGHAVTLFEREGAPGGMCNCIPDFRLRKEVLQSDISWLLSLSRINLVLNQSVEEPRVLLEQGYHAVVVAVGLWAPISLGVPGEETAISGIDLLRRPSDFHLNGRVAVVGGGATAYDCAMTALQRGARQTELFALEKLSEMPLTRKELDGLLKSGIEVNGRTRVTSISTRSSRVCGLSTVKVRLREGAAAFNLRDIESLPGTEGRREDIDAAVIAIGLRSTFPRLEDPRLFYAGDCVEGPTTVVEAAAAGKNAADRVDAFLQARPLPTFTRNQEGHVKSRIQIPGYAFCPVHLDTDFFGRTLRSPFLLSAAPPTDGLEQVRKAYRAGWAGAIMKTAFDGVPIHIPGEYMFAFDERTYANCDNVSGHPLERVCREVETLVREFPDRLTIASTGGPVTRDEGADCRQWQSNTRKLEQAGAMAIEYSLSCPQGGDGTEGDIVSQNAQLSAKIVDWVLSGGAGHVPKLFKLTGAATSVSVIVAALQEVFARHPGKRAGITLANSFPTLAFRPGTKKEWDEGVIVGASGAGILHISYLSLAKVAHLGVHVSGNGGPMDYRAAANFLALGARTVQFCTLAMKYGYGIIDDLHAGLSHLMARRGIGSVEELVGIALPQPITDFMALSSTKKISSASRDLCLQCGNCGRCPYLAISPGVDGFPVTDPARCVGCSICSLKCFAQAITMRPRTPEEAASLREA
jgi:NADPH-dependent glutamate synthase beta subunit-like oxidoreductase/dihydroorotate dehydrogenase/Pyruvate/2-oxoacid:ferredoxin oxidoreductase delta subunit